MEVYNVNGQAGTKEIIEKIRTNSREVQVKYLIKKTVVRINHIFLNVDGMWWLVLIKDESD